ncbi:MAG: hypothetical protein JWR02_1114 [Mucilaginibacter sp.]|nr:hypothetical protein [Mucilaginibacter sp.]
MKPLIKYISILLFCGFLILPKLSPFGMALEQGYRINPSRSMKKTEATFSTKSPTPDLKNSFSFFDVALQFMPVLKSLN